MLPISVAMATYNGGRFLRQQLDSIAAQTQLPAELVVSDDGSTDDTLDVVRAFAATAPFPVRVLPKPDRLGYADNFLFAAQNCASPLVAFADQDDVWLPAKLERGATRLLADDSLLSMHQLTMTDGDLRPTGAWEQGITANRVFDPLDLDPWAGWGNSMMFRRELASLIPRGARPRHPELSQPLAHDTWLYVVAAALGRVSHIAEPLILYRQHGGNAFGMRKPGWRARLRTVATVPVESYRERDIFFAHLADLFDALADRSDGPMRERARAAAGRYRERRWRAATRAEIHAGRRWEARLRAYARLYASRGDEWTGLSARLPSALKDLILGVSGWGHHV